MADTIEIFRNWDDYYQYANMPDIDAKKQYDYEELQRKYTLRTNAMRMCLDSEYINLTDILFIENTYAELLLSCIYTAKHLLYSKISISAVDLAYSYYRDKKGDPNSIEWLKLPEDLSTKQILKNDNKDYKLMSGGDQNNWKKVYINKTKKPFFFQLVDYNEEEKTIPFFMHQLSYLVLFSRKRSPGIEKNRIKLNSYSNFCDDIISFNKSESSIDTILLNYKFEKIFKPWVIYSYQQLLKTQCRKTYFDEIKWELILDAYDAHMPCGICDFAFDNLVAGMIAESMNIFCNQMDQIKYFSNTFEESIPDIKLIGEVLKPFKKWYFHNKLLEYGDINTFISEMTAELIKLPLVEYKNKSLEDIKVETQKRIEKLNNAVRNKFQTSFFNDMSDIHQIKKKEICISKRVPIECRKLFD